MPNPTEIKVEIRQIKSYDFTMHSQNAKYLNSGDFDAFISESKPDPYLTSQADCDELHEELIQMHDWHEENGDALRNSSVSSRRRPRRDEDDSLLFPGN